MMVVSILIPHAWAEPELIPPPEAPTASATPRVGAFVPVRPPTGAAPENETAELDAVRDLTKEAYIFAYPLISNYRTLLNYAIDTASPEYKGPFNSLVHMARPYMAGDAVMAPSNDTISSFGWLDLRTEPVVLTIPAVGKERYFSVTLVDLFTHNFAVMGTRNEDAKGGSFLVAGPGWKGKTPGGITRTFRSETEFAFAIVRLQLFGPGDFVNLQPLQQQFQVRTLSTYLKQPAPKRANPASFPRFIPERAEGPGFIGYLNFLLKYSQSPPQEAKFLKRLAKIGVGAGKPFDSEMLSPEVTIAMEAGIEDAKAKVNEAIPRVRTLYKLYGNREVFGGNYFNRYLGAKLGLYAPDWEEVLYLPIAVDALGRPLDGRDGVQYLLKFPPGGLPPAKAFWSLSLYQGANLGFFANPYDRFALNSAIKPDFVKDEDGGLTLYIGEYSPGPGPDVNWLPAPAGPFTLTLRLYWPEKAALEGRWKVPPLQKVLPNIPDVPFDPPFVKSAPKPTPNASNLPRTQAPFVSEAPVVPAGTEEITLPSPLASPTPVPQPTGSVTPPFVPTIQVPVIRPPMLDEAEPTPMPERRATAN